MNTQLSVVRSYKSTDHLIVLSDHDALVWAKDFLNPVEQKMLANAAKQGIGHFFLPQEKRNIVVQFLKNSPVEFDDQEDARVAGNNLLSLLTHYKLEKVMVLNRRSSNRLLDFVEGMILGNYQFLKYHNKNGRRHTLKKITLEQVDTDRKQLALLKAVLEATCIARDLVNEPQSYLSAENLSKEIRQLGKEVGFKVTIFDKKKIEQLKMGGLLAVNMGSMRPPRFNIVEYKPAKAKNKKPIVLVGKGIVYDTGGLSLKSTSNSMDMMKSDMAGAATVISTVVAAAKAKLPLHLIALVPSTDNRPGNNAYVPGDVITMYDGTTVEILNTDAEGRLVLADALHYAKKYKPELVLDFATLTGSAMHAVGPQGICYMGNADTSIKRKLEDSGYKVYERLIEFPLWREYGDHLKSNIADLKNVGGSTAGVITAGKFLEFFTDYPWLHFDIAGSAYLKSPNGYRTKEGTGVGVRLMFDFLKSY